MEIHWVLSALKVTRSTIELCSYKLTLTERIQTIEERVLFKSSISFQSYIRTFKITVAGTTEPFFWLFYSSVDQLFTRERQRSRRGEECGSAMLRCWADLQQCHFSEEIPTACSHPLGVDALGGLRRTVLILSIWHQYKSIQIFPTWSKDLYSKSSDENDLLPIAI